MGNQKLLCKYEITNNLRNKLIPIHSKIYIDNYLLPIKNVYILKGSHSVILNLLALKEVSNDNFFIVNFDISDFYLEKKYDLVAVKYDFSIAELITEKYRISVIKVNFLEHKNWWVLKKGMIDYLNLKNSKIISNRKIKLKKTI
ncbi:MAG: hypothetical protein ACRDCG_00930 [Mycoplasmoidaceae bacterium]